MDTVIYFVKCAVWAVLVGLAAAGLDTMQP